MSARQQLSSTCTAGLSCCCGACGTGCQPLASRPGDGAPLILRRGQQAVQQHRGRLRRQCSAAGVQQIRRTCTAWIKICLMFTAYSCHDEAFWPNMLVISPSRTHMSVKWCCCIPCTVPGAVGQARTQALPCVTAVRTAACGWLCSGGSEATKTSPTRSAVSRSQAAFRCTRNLGASGIGRRRGGGSGPAAAKVTLTSSKGSGLWHHTSSYSLKPQLCTAADTFDHDGCLPILPNPAETGRDRVQCIP